MRKEEVVVALAGLLHDIGKLVYRAERRRAPHEDLGADLLEELLRGVGKEVVDAVRYHHYERRGSSPPKGTRDLVDVIVKADRIAAGMERVKVEEEHPNFGGEFLVNVLWRIGGEKRDYNDCPRFDPAPVGGEAGDSPDTVFDFLFPIDPMKWEEGRRPYHHKDLLEGFKRTWEHLKISQALRDTFGENCNGRNVNCEKVFSVFSRLLKLLEKYTLNTPQYTLKDPNNVVSLFTHLKLTSAFALCLIRSKGGDVVLVGGDLSGIQNFIGMVKGEACAKSLRIRSFYLDALTELSAYHVAQALDLTPANILFTGGGRFTVIAPADAGSSHKIRDQLEEVEGRISESLPASVSDNVRVNIACTSPIRLQPGKDAGKGLGEIFQEKVAEIGRELDIRKSRPKIRKFVENPWHRTQDCGICGEMAKREGQRGLCDFCEKVKSVGASGVIKARYVSFGDFRPWDEGAYAIFNWNFAERWTGGSTAAVIHDIWDCLKWPEAINLYVPCGAFGRTLSFEEMAEAARGYRLLGVLRMDVDGLGKAFRRFGKTLGTYWEISNRLSLFFKNIVLEMCRGRGFEKYRRFLRDLLRPGENIPVQVLYAGGDDLCIVGAWDHVLDLAFVIREHFVEEYVGGDWLTISAGFFTFRPKFPVGRAFDEAGRLLEEYAKEHKRDGKGKDAIALSFADIGTGQAEGGRLDALSRPMVLGWEDFRRMVDLFSEIKQAANLRTEGDELKMDMPRFLLARLITLLKDVAFGKGVTQAKALARLFYNFGRHGKAHKLAGWLSEKYSDVKRLLSAREAEILYLSLLILFMLTRPRGGE